MRPFRDLTGKVFGRWTVLRQDGEHVKRRYICQCECGTISSVRGDSLERNSRSCGCLQKEVIGAIKFKHGVCVDGKINGNSTYVTWKSMRQRCKPSSDPKKMKYYVERGITVCDRWLNSFENFLEDMGERPEGMTIDRIDNDGNYEPGNCRWTTDSEQNLNKQIHSKSLTIDFVDIDWKPEEH